MFVPFNELSGTSRIWIYQCNRELKAEEVNEINKLAEDFAGIWTAHQNTLHASFDVLHNIFLVLAVDENKNDASGCSIDKSVSFIRNLENRFNVSFFDRLGVAFRIGQEVRVKTLNDFLNFYNKENLGDSVPVFNNLVLTKEDLKTKWEIPLKEGWVAGKI